MTEYLIFGRDDCSYCDKAKKLLDVCDATYEYKEAKDLDPFYVAQIERALGHEMKTVPQIFKFDEDGEAHYVGGYRELSQAII